MRETDRRVLRTRAVIKETAKQMICEMDAEKITVKALAERAGIHRKTFYLHYPYIEALVEEMLQDILREYLMEMDKLEMPLSMTKTNRVFFQFFSAQEPYVEKLLCGSSYQSYCDRLLFQSLEHNQKRLDPPEGFPQEKIRVVNNFMVQGTLNIYRQWVREGKKISLEEITELAGTLLEQGVRAVW